MFIFLQHIVPQKLLTRLVGRLARARMGRLTTRAIRWFVKQYDVDMSQALKPDPADYASFNDFFTRELKANARPVDQTEGGICAPADGCVSAFGAITSGDIIQAKGHHYSARALMGGSSVLSQPFESGSFITEYLSPKDYHRVHMPCDGRLTDMIYVPGRLFSVNNDAVLGVPGLFARNERVINIFETEHGLMALIMVGAMIVGNIEMQWAGQINPDHNSVMESWRYDQRTVVCQKGQEIGRFNMGSTVILLFERHDVAWKKGLKSGDALQMGQGLARITS